MLVRVNRAVAVRAPLRLALITIVHFGCTALSTSQTARVIPKGTSRFGAGVTSGYNIVKNSDFDKAPLLELSYRYGLADHLDVGLRARPISALAEVKYEFLDTGRWFAS